MLPQTSGLTPMARGHAVQAYLRTLSQTPALCIRLMIMLIRKYAELLYKLKITTNTKEDSDTYLLQPGNLSTGLSIEADI